jgi:tetratricopeptide (TPR) repeat protein
MTNNTATKRTTQKLPRAKLEMNRSRTETLNRLSAVESILSPFWSLRCGVRSMESKKITLLIALVLGVHLMGPTRLLASEGRSSVFDQPAAVAAPTPEVDVYHQGVAATKQKDYQRAVLLFQQALQSDPRNPDVLNMLAFSLRKSGHLDEAFDYYRQALEIKPQFPEAREYLGEAHLQAALREIQTLKSYGASGHEDLEDLTKAIKSAAASL